MELICRCGRPIAEKDAGLCEPCWKALFEDDSLEKSKPLPLNVIRLETELPF